MKVNEEALKKYNDIIDLPRPVSKTHPPMERYKRAAQFAPFAALTGYEDAISQTQKYMEEKWEDEYEVESQRTAGSIFPE